MRIPYLEYIELPWLLPLVIVLPVAFALLLRRARALLERLAPERPEGPCRIGPERSNP